MQDEGFSHVAVQSLHTIGGAEYHDLRRTVGAFKVMGGFQHVILGYPLLATQQDMQRTTDVHQFNLEGWSDGAQVIFPSDVTIMGDEIDNIVDILHCCGESYNGFIFVRILIHHRWSSGSAIAADVKIIGNIPKSPR